MTAARASLRRTRGSRSPAPPPLRPMPLAARSPGALPLARRLLGLSLLAAALLATGARANLRVVTTTQDPGAITRAVGGDRVSVTTLCKGYQDPHFLDAKPSFMLELNKADLIEVVGLDLEIGYVPSLVQGARNPKIARGSDEPP